MELRRGQVEPDVPLDRGRHYGFPRHHVACSQPGKWTQPARWLRRKFIEPTQVDLDALSRLNWDALAQVEENWDRRCRKNWPKFLRACAVALLDRLPPEAAEWIAEADRFENGERSKRQWIEARQRAWQSYNARLDSATHAERCALYVALYRLLPHKADWPTEEYCETCNFIECCFVAGITNEVLSRLFREHLPSAFEPRPWWKFW